MPMKKVWYRLAIAAMLAACGSDGNNDDSGSTDSTPQGMDGGDPSSEGTADRGTAEDALPPWPGGKYIPINEVYERVRAGDPEMLLVNVSDEEFYDMGHIEGSLKIPWDLLNGRLDEVDADKHIVIYCRRGVRSESAYDTLTANDYPLVWVMESGLEAWIAAGYPTVAD